MQDEETRLQMRQGRRRGGGGTCSCRASGAPAANAHSTTSWARGHAVCATTPAPTALTRMASVDCRYENCCSGMPSRTFRACFAQAYGSHFLRKRRRASESALGAAYAVDADGAVSARRREAAVEAAEERSSATDAVAEAVALMTSSFASCAWDSREGTCRPLEPELFSVVLRCAALRVLWRCA